MIRTGRIPHNRKWPVYTMKVGECITIENPPKRLRRALLARTALHGIVLRFKQIRPGDRGFVVTRVA